jgi:hypothetical protein
VPDDDVVDLPAIDLDVHARTQSAGDGTTGPARSARDARPRWLVLPLVLLAGGVLGAYVADLRADSAASNTVSLQYGGADVQMWGQPSDGGLRIGIDLLNTGTRPLELYHVSISGLEDDEVDRPTRDDDTTTLLPGKWVTVSLVRQPDCGATPDVSVIGGGSFGGPDGSITVDVALDGVRTEATLIGPQSSTSSLQQMAEAMCSQTNQPHLATDLVDAGAPSDGRMTMTWAHVPFISSPDGDVRVTSIESSTPGLRLDVTGLPFSTADHLQFDVVWTVENCTMLVDPGEASLYVRFAFPDGSTTASTAGMDAASTFALGALVADTCGTENGLGPGSW